MLKAETKPDEQDDNETLIIEAEESQDDGGDDIDKEREALLNMERPEEGDTDEADDDDETEGDENAEGEGDDEEEFEIALDGDEGGSHPTKDDDRGIRKRINKLNRKVEAAKEGKSEAEEALEIERDRNRLLQIALDQANGGKPKDDGAPPDPNDFDGGVTDPAFIAALQDHVAAGVLAKTQATQTQTRQETQAQDVLHGQQVEHYKRADKLKVSDYDDTEDKAIDILGQDAVNQLIANSDKSEVVLYWLGKNPEQAERLKGLIDSSPVKAVLELGRLEAKLVARPKSKGKPAPNPDKETRGGGAGRKRDRRGPVGATFT